MPALSEGIWVLPQRGRPASFEALISSIKWCDPKARVVVIFDDDDETLTECIDMLPDNWSKYVMSNNHSTAAKMNYAVSLYPMEKFYGLLANDVEVQTEHALTLLAENCPEFGLSFPNDTIQGASLATHPCVSGELVRALGWWAYPQAKHTCIDLYLTNIAYDAGGCRYLPEVKFFHKHHTHDRSPYDDVYQKGDLYKDEDIAASERWKGGDEVKARERVKEVMCQPS